MVGQNAELLNVKEEFHMGTNELNNNIRGVHV